MRRSPASAGKSWRPRLALLFAPAAAIACSDEGPRTPDAVVVTPNAPRVPLGQTLQLTATVVDDEGREVPDEPISYQSSDAAVLTVSESGLLTSVGPRGSATIRATSGAATTEVEAEVVLGPSALFVSPGSLSLESDGEAQLAFAVTDENGDSIPDAEVLFQTSDLAVALVTGEGFVRAGEAGSATITVTSGEYRREVPVTVVQVPHSVRLTPATLVLAPGGSEQLTAEALDLGGDPIPGAAITFSSGDEAILAVDAAGGITSLGPEGLVTVTATSGSLSATAKVYVGTPALGDVLSTVEVDGAWKVAMASDDRYLLATLGSQLLSGTLPDFGFPVSIPFDGATLDIAVDAAGTLAYVPRAETEEGVLGVGVVDLAANEVTDFIPSRFTAATGNLFRVALSDDESRVVVGTHVGFEVLDVATGATVASNEDGQIERLVPDPVRPLVYGLTFGGQVIGIELEGEVTAGALALPGGLADIAVSPDGARLYALEAGAPVIHVYDLETDEEEASLTTAGGTGLAITPDGKFLWVLDEGRVTVLEPSEGVVLRAFELGIWPRQVAFAGEVAIVVDNPGTPLFPTAVHFVR